MRFSFLFRSLFSLSLICITTYFLINYSSNKLKNIYYEIGLKECNKHVSLLVSDIVDNSIDEEEFSDSMVSNVTDNYKEFNTIYLQSIVKNVSSNLYDVLSIDNNYNIFLEIPFSLVYDNVLLSSFGPSIPIRYKLLTDAKVNMISKVSSFGINNALIELLLEFEFDVLIYIPLNSKSDKITMNIPIYSSIIEGNVPSIAFGEHEIM